jgi:hypothetical protein
MRRTFPLLVSGNHVEQPPASGEHSGEVWARCVPGTRNHVDMVAEVVGVVGSRR